MRFSIVIPTYKRENDLERFFDSAIKQSLLPYEIILIDDDALEISYIKKWMDKFVELGVEFVYYKKDHSKEDEFQGCTSSRNIGVDKARSEVVFILDDDLILEKDYFLNIMKIWNNNKDKNLIGVGGIITNNREKRLFEKIYNLIFALESKVKWDVNDRGFQVWDNGIKELTKGYYMHGGVCAYDKKKTQELGFTVFAHGRTGLIDPEFSIKAKQKGYYFLIDPNSKVEHKHSSSGREKAFLAGIKETRNRKFMFREYCKQNIANKIIFFWSWFGWTLRQVLTFKFAKSLGMIKGLYTK